MSAVSQPILQPLKQSQAFEYSDGSRFLSGLTPTAPIERPVPSLSPVAGPMQGETLDIIENHFDPILVDSISNPRYRPILLRADVELEIFVLDGSITRLPVVPPLFPYLGNSFLRLLIHRLADTYCITRSLEQAGHGAGGLQMGNNGSVSGYLVLNKTANTRIPTVRLSALANKYMPAIGPASGLAPSEHSPNTAAQSEEQETPPPSATPTVLRIMSRSSSSDMLSSKSSDQASITSAEEASRRLTFQEREAAYLEARERIFRESLVEQPSPQASTSYLPPSMTNALDSLSLNTPRPIPTGPRKGARLSPSAAVFDPSFSASARFDYYPTVDQQFRMYNSGTTGANLNAYSHQPTLPPPPPGYEYPPFSTRTDPPPEPETLPRTGVPPWTNQTISTPDGTIYPVPPSQQVMRFVFANQSSSTAGSSSSRPSSSASSPQIPPSARQKSDSVLFPPSLSGRSRRGPASEMSSSSSTGSSRTAASSLSNRGSVSYGPGLPELKEMRSPTRKRRQAKSSSSVTSSSSRIDEDSAEYVAERQAHPLPVKPAWVRKVSSTSSTSSSPSPLHSSTLSQYAGIPTGPRNQSSASSIRSSYSSSISEEVPLQVARPPTFYNEHALPEIAKTLTRAAGRDYVSPSVAVRPPRSV